MLHNVLKVFQDVDDSKEGTITCDVLSQVLEALGMPAAHAEHLLALAAATHGSKMHYEEFITWLFGMDGRRQHIEEVDQSVAPSLAEIVDMICEGGGKHGCLGEAVLVEELLQTPELLHALIQGLSSEVSISKASLQSCNGNYRCTGFFNDRPMYTHIDGAAEITSQDGKWCVNSYDETMSELYAACYQINSSNVRPPSGVWHQKENVRVLEAFECDSEFLCCEGCLGAVNEYVDDGVLIQFESSDGLERVPASKFEKLKFSKHGTCVVKASACALCAITFEFCKIYVQILAQLLGTEQPDAEGIYFVFLKANVTATGRLSAEEFFGVVRWQLEWFLDHAPFGSFQIPANFEPVESVGKIKVTVVTLSGTTTELEVEDTSTGIHLKEVVGSFSGIPTRAQRLVLQGSVLADGKVLHQMGVSNNSVLFLLRQKPPPSVIRLLDNRLENSEIDLETLYTSYVCKAYVPTEQRKDDRPVYKEMPQPDVSYNEMYMYYEEARQRWIITDQGDYTDAYPDSAYAYCLNEAHCPSELPGIPWHICHHNDTDYVETMCTLEIEP